MGVVHEVYAPVAMAVNASANIVGGGVLGGFSCATSGALTLASGGTTYLNAMPVTAGMFHVLPYGIPSDGFQITLSGGASGALAAV